MTREELTVGSRVEVFFSNAVDGNVHWFRGTIREIDDPEGDEVFIVNIDNSPDGFPAARVRRYSPNLRTLSILELIAEAASE